MGSTGQPPPICSTTRQRPGVVTCSLILYYLEAESRGSADRTTLRGFRSVEGRHKHDLKSIKGQGCSRTCPRRRCGARNRRFIVSIAIDRIPIIRRSQRSRSQPSGQNPTLRTVDSIYDTG